MSIENLKPNPPIEVSRDLSGGFLNCDRWPLVEVDCPENLTLLDLELHFDAICRLGEAGERFALLINLNARQSAQREFRQYVAKHLQDLNQRFGHVVIAAAHVSDNWLNRAVLTVIFHLSPVQYPHQTFRSRESAMLWIQQRLDTDIATHRSSQFRST